jgi:hypothetical protein
VVAVVVATIAVLLRTGPDLDRFVAATAYAVLVASTYATVVRAIRNGGGSPVLVVVGVEAALLCAAVALSRRGRART